MNEALAKAALDTINKQAARIAELEARLAVYDEVARSKPTLKSPLAAALANPHGSGLTSSITIGHSDEPGSLGGGDLSAAVPNLFKTEQ